MSLVPVLAIVTGLAIVVAFTTLPILSVIAVLLGTRRASSGFWFAGAYAIGLAIVFTLASLGVNLVIPDAWLHPGAIVEVVCGALLVGAAAFWWARERRRRGQPAPRHRLLDWLGTLGPVACAVAGLQFAFHPENLLLTIAAAGHTRGVGALAVALVGVWFCVLGVSTVATPSLMYARSGTVARARLEAVQRWIGMHGGMLTVWLLLVAGAPHS